MELKISKIQWKKVIAFALTLCMTISMVQLPVNAEETTEPNTTKYFRVSDLEYYKQTATFFDAAADGSRDAIDVTPMEEEDKAYTIDPTEGYYDAKWFSFTPSEDGVYSFKGEDIENNEVDSYGALMEKDGEEYRYITKNDDRADNYQFEIKSTLKKGKTYYLCAGYLNKGEVKYNVKVSKVSVKVLQEDKSETFSSEVPQNYIFTPSETGYYNLKFAWDSEVEREEEKYYVRDENSNEVDYKDTSSKNNGLNRMYLFEKGHTYYLDIKWFQFWSEEEEDYVNINMNITLSKIASEELEEGTTKHFKANSEGKIFNLTVNNTGWYLLKYACSEKENVTISNNLKLRDSSDDYVGYINSDADTYFMYLQKGESYNLNQREYSVEYNDGSDVPDDIDVSVSIARADQADISTTQKGTLTADKDGKIFVFTPDKSGYYKVNSSWDSGNANIFGQYAMYEEEYDEYEEIKGNSLGSSFGFNAKKGNTYYLIVTPGYDSEEVLKDEITIEISDAEDSLDVITSEKPGEYATTNSYNDAKTFKYVANDTGYYKLSFDWDKKLTKNTYMDTNVQVKDAEGKGLYRVYNDLDDLKMYMKQGQTYYVDVNFICFEGYDGENPINVKVNISQIPQTELGYNQVGNLRTNTGDKLFKFTAQQDGYHILICRWNNTDNQMVAWGNITYSDDYYVSNAKIAKENNAYYRKFKCKKGETYYINLTNMAFKSVSTKEDVDNVDVEVSVSYYNGKTDLDTIKNTQPWTPDQNNGNNDKPNNGNTDNGNTNKPSTPEQKPSNNTTVKPATIKVSKIKIAAPSNKIAAGKKVKLTATVAPANASNKSVKWTTSNKKVAVVSKSGVVTVNKKAGGKTVVITAVAADGKGARATYKITVMKDAVKKVTITGKNVVKAGKKLKLKAKVAAGKKANKKLVWSTSNKKFATVNQKGVVTAKKAGKGKKVKITAKATDGSNKKKVFTIKIK